MYHILAAHGQAQFCRCKALNRLDFQSARMGCAIELALAVGGTVGRLDQQLLLGEPEEEGAGAQHVPESFDGKVPPVKPSI